jgi:hypothetical protein
VVFSSDGVSSQSMDSDTQRRVGQMLVLGSVLGTALFLVSSAVLAPPVGQTAGNSDDARRTLVGVQGSPSPGEVLLLEGSDVVYRDANATSYHDVTALDDGTTLSTFVTKGSRQCGRFESPCARTGVRILDPDTGDIAFEWAYPVRSDLNSEVHDAEPLPSGEILVVGMEYERVFSLARNGTITWQWNASAYYDAPADPTKTDWLHMNDVDRIGDGKYLVSVRNENQLIVIERGEGVTEVVNEVGSANTLRAQHNPQYLNDESIVVADSENDRVVELAEIGGQWAVVWSLSSAGGIEFDWPRDADRLPNGHTLVTDSRNNRVVEVTESGDVVWSVAVDGLPYEADRLPGGEDIHGGPYSNLSKDVATPAESDETGREIPVFSTIYVTLIHVAPVPYWAGVWHVIAVTATVLLVVVGSVLWRTA